MIFVLVAESGDGRRTLVAAERPENPGQPLGAIQKLETVQAERRAVRETFLATQQEYLDTCRQGDLTWRETIEQVPEVSELPEK